MPQGISAGRLYSLPSNWTDCAAEDIEFVHRARVATRRLRAALRMFDRCFAQKQVQRWRQAIHRVTAALGEARDRDVQIEFLCGTLSAMRANECFPGVARVLVSLEHDRERLQRRVVKAVRRLKAAGILREMRRAGKRILRQVGTPSDDARTPEALARTSRHVLRWLDKLAPAPGCPGQSGRPARHHAMRIAAKRLRYTMEICRPMYPGRLDEPVEAVKRVQTLLGEIHDCDVSVAASWPLRLGRAQTHHEDVWPRRAVSAPSARHRASSGRTAPPGAGRRLQNWSSVGPNWGVGDCGTG